MPLHRKHRPLPLIHLLLFSVIVHLLACTHPKITRADPSCLTTPDQEIALQHVNRERQSKGLSVLQCNKTLNEAAAFWNQNMCQDRFFSHQDPRGVHGFSKRMSQVNQQLSQQGWHYSRGAENIYAGSPSAGDAVRAWMKSPGHRRNILTPQLTHMGIHHLDCQGRHLWTQIFVSMKRATARSLRSSYTPKTQPYLRLRPGTVRRSQTKKQKTFYKNGKRYTQVIIITKTTTVLRGAQKGSRKVKIKTERVSILRSAHGSKTEKRTSYQTKILHDS